MRNTRLCLSQSLVLASALAYLPAGSVLTLPDHQDKTTDTVYDVGHGVTVPKPISIPDPEYSENARKQRIQGTVVLAMIVTAEGNVRDVKVTKSLDNNLDRQALAAVGAWKFGPATKDGKPVAVHLSTDITFRMY